jgi:hypothetical protein
LRRFLFFSLPLLLLTMAVFQFALEAFHQTITPAGALPGLPGWVVLGTWFLESLGLCCLYLLIHGAGGGGRFWNGLVTGWIAWVFRGPLLVISVVTLGGLPPAPWWALTFRWWFLYTGCGLLLGAVAGVAELPGTAAVEIPAPAAPPPPLRAVPETLPRQWLAEPDSDPRLEDDLERRPAATEPFEDR